MTSTIKVNNVQNQCGANIINENSNTITIGASGDTIALASGASQTGFGRTGTVDWQTTKKTTDFTAVNGEGYFVDTGSGVVTVTLPASPAAGNIVAIKDYDGNFGTNKCTIARNGSNIRGAASNTNLEKNNSGVVCIYVDATEGWQLFFDGSDSDAQATFISATGGTITNSPCGNFKIHTFTGPGTFTVTQESDVAANNEVSYLVVAGGGGGGRGGGGGGAGGFRESKSGVDNYSPASPLEGSANITVTSQAYPIAVGGGGAGSTSSPAKGTSGVNSTFSTITSAGGGGGGSHDNIPGLTGGSGGGNGNGGAASGASAVSGNTPPVSPPQGEPGGSIANPNAAPAFGGSGGGGATAAGGQGTPSVGGAGGAGATTSINGSPVTRSGGGGGSVYGGCGQGAGGSGGGGAGGPGSPPGAGVVGTINTGGGGGGGGHGNNAPGSAGGSGIVIIRYKFQA